jgi:hypothetical protein
MRPSLRSRSISRPDRGCQPTDGCGALSHCTNTKGGKGLGAQTMKFAVTSIFHITLGPITEAERWRESSTPLRVSGSHRIRCCSSSPSQRPADLLPLHRQVPLRRLQRCRVHRTCPLVRRGNPKALSAVPLLTFRPTRCHPSRSLSTNTSVILTPASRARVRISDLVRFFESGPLSRLDLFRSRVFTA